MKLWYIRVTCTKDDHKYKIQASEKHIAVSGALGRHTKKCGNGVIAVTVVDGSIE